MINVSPLVEEARPIVAAAAQVYYAHTRPWFVGLLVHGSALKGGFIPGCSDIDLQLYLQEDAFQNGALPLDLMLAIQRDLSKIDPAPFAYIQCYPLPPGGTVAGIGPIPGTYRMVMGELPSPEATPEQVFAQVRESLATLQPMHEYIRGGLLNHGGNRLDRAVRLLCTDVSPALYNVLCLRENSIAVWTLTKNTAIERLSPDEPMGQAVRAFYEVVRAYYGGEPSQANAFAAIIHGVEFLQLAREWYASETR